LSSSAPKNIWRKAEDRASHVATGSERLKPMVFGNSIYVTVVPTTNRVKIPNLYSHIITGELGQGKHKNI
jgi:hypothetical protein